MAGALVRDAEVRTAGSTTLVEFTLVHTEKWKDKNNETQEVKTWVKCTKWGANEKLAKYLTKGTVISASGMPKATAYMKDGKTQGSLEMKVESIDFLSSAGSKSDSSNHDTQDFGNNQPPRMNGSKQNPPQQGVDMPDESMPF